MRRTQHATACAHQWGAVGNDHSLRLLCVHCGLAARLERKQNAVGEWQVTTELQQRNPGRTARVDAPEFVDFAGDVLAATAAIYGAPAVQRFLAASVNPLHLPLPGLDVGGQS